MNRSIVFGSVLLLMASAARAQQPVPADVPKSKPALAAHVREALGVAEAKNKRVLLAFLGAAQAGADVGALLKKDRKLARQLLYEFVVSTVPSDDTASPGAFGIDVTKDLPALVVTDAAGKALATLRKGDLVTDSGATIVGADLAKRLEPLHCAPLDGQKVFDAALATAKKDGKRLFVHFDAPW